jgi:hypothetical protein
MDGLGSMSLDAMSAMDSAASELGRRCCVSTSSRNGSGWPCAGSLSLSPALHGFHVEGRHVDELSVVRRRWAEDDSPYGRLADDDDKRTAAPGDKNSGKAAAAPV